MSQPNASQPKYPDITVELLGGDGNAFHIIGKVRKALQRGGVSRDEIKTFQSDAMSGDYDHLLRTCMTWVNVE